IAVRSFNSFPTRRSSDLIYTGGLGNRCVLLATGFLERTCCFWSCLLHFDLRLYFTANLLPASRTRHMEGCDLFYPSVWFFIWQSLRDYSVRRYRFTYGLITYFCCPRLYHDSYP